MAFGRRRAVLLKLADHPVGYGAFQRYPFNCPINLHGNDFFPHVFLRTWHKTLRAAQIIVAFLRLGGDETPALAAPEQAAIQVWLQLGGLGLAFLRCDFLHPVEQALGNDRLVPAFVQFAVECHHSVEKRVLEHPLVIRNGHALVRAGRKPYLLHSSLDFMEGIFAGSVQFKSFADERGLFRVDSDAAVVAVVEIPHRRPVGPDAVPQFLAYAAFDILREIINVVFALAEGDVQHEFPVRGRFKAESGEAQILDFAGIHQIHDPAAVHAVPGQAVGMPCKDALGFAFLNLAQHEVELRASGLFGRAAFLKRVDDVQSFASGHLLKLENLRLDGQHLAVAFVG